MYFRVTLTQGTYRKDSNINLSTIEIVHKKHLEVSMFEIIKEEYVYFALIFTSKTTRHER